MNTPATAERDGAVVSEQRRHHVQIDEQDEGANMSADEFSRDPAGLPEAGRPQLLELADGDTLDLRIGPVSKRLSDTTVRMLGYNGSIPGPTLKVQQGSEINVQVTNDGDLDATVHRHWLRLENKYDGVPHATQAPIPVGGEFSYRIQFPDPGLYWYHPHFREDYALELGLYGNILVVPAEPDYWPPADRDLVLTLDDILIENGKVAPFSQRNHLRSHGPLRQRLSGERRTGASAGGEGG
jgi:FtsP/CotA-like multicopper oxidase with cupredoxin domain